MQEDKAPSCVVTLYMSPVMLVLYGLPYLLRGLRVVILADKGKWPITVFSTSAGQILLACHDSFLVSDDDKYRGGAALSQSVKNRKDHPTFFIKFQP